MIAAASAIGRRRTHSRFLFHPSLAFSSVEFSSGQSTRDHSMWPTSTGSRTLHDAESALVAAAIVVMLNSLDESFCDDADEVFQPQADMQFGIPIFDSLTFPQRIATLHYVAMHLLTEAVPETEDTSAVEDATIAAIFSEIQDQVSIEVGFDCAGIFEDAIDSNKASEFELKSTHWRSLVLAACRQALPDERDLDEEESNGLPLDAYDSHIDAWENAIDLLVSNILWDRDFELADGFMDQDPASARNRRRLLGIPDNYFVQPPLDPTVSQTRLLLAQVKSLVLRRPR